MNPGEAALRFVLAVHARLRNMALLDAFAGPAAFVLLASAGVLALSRSGNLEGMPDRFMIFVFGGAGFLALARLVKTIPRVPDAARHLDRELEAKERWTTMLEASSSDLPVAQWAARGALDGLGGRSVKEVVPYRPPAATVPLLLAVVLLAGLGLLPVSPAEAGSPSAPEVVVAASATGGSSGRTTDRTRPSRDPRVLAATDVVRDSEPDPAAVERVLADLQRRATDSGDVEQQRAVEEARAAAAEGDTDATRAAIRAAAERIFGADAVSGGATVTGSSGDGSASGATGATGTGHDKLRFPVRPRAREAVRRYFEGIGSEVR